MYSVENITPNVALVQEESCFEKLTFQTGRLNCICFDTFTRKSISILFAYFLRARISFIVRCKANFDVYDCNVCSIP